MKKHKFGFTLAEVLITLGIIGVVAAVVMPSVIADGREKENISKLKKVFSTLTQTYTIATNIYGTPDAWELTAANSPVGANNMMKIIKQNYRVHKNCETNGECWYDKKLTLLDKSEGNNYGVAGNFATMQIVDGMYMAFSVIDPNCSSTKGTAKPLGNVCGIIAVDLNSNKGPNQVGYDIYYFYITKLGIQPFGLEEETSYTFKDSCNESSDGYGCAAWVIYNANMDYLHCDGLDWKTKTKCKKGDKKYETDL